MFADSLYVTHVEYNHFIFEWHLVKHKHLVQTLGQSVVHSSTDVYLANESPCRTNLLTSRCSDPIPIEALY
jgi:hypothetical protein